MQEGAEEKEGRVGGGSHAWGQVAISVPRGQVSVGSTANPESCSLGTASYQVLAWGSLGPVKGRKCHLSTSPGEWGSVSVRATCSVPVSGACPLGAVQSSWLLQGWLCSTSLLLVWPIPSKYSCFPSRQWSQPILWSFSLPHVFTRLKISSCISQMGNVRCSWSSGCPVYNYCKPCWIWNVFTFASLGVLSRWSPDIQLSIKTTYVTLLSDLTENSQWEESWEGHPSARAVSPETSLLARIACPSSDPPRAEVLCGAILFMLSSLTARLHHF